MRPRLLRDPNAPEGGNTPAPTPPPSPAPAMPPPAPSDPPRVISMSEAEYRNLLAAQDELRRAQAAERQRADQADQERARALAERGQIEEALNTTRAGLQRDLEAERQRNAEMARRVHDRERRAALAGAIAAFETSTKQSVLPASRGHLEKLWAGDFEVAEDPGRPDSFVVREKGTLRPIQDVVADRLKQPEHAMFLAAGTKGGTANPGGLQPGDAAEPDRPRNLGDAVALQFVENRRQSGPIGLGGKANSN